MCFAVEHPFVPPPSVVPEGLVARRASEIIPEAIEWLWPKRIALGKQTVIGGDGGLGKSQLGLWMAAAVTRGGAWPNGEGRAPKGSAIVLCAEDGSADTVRPRLDPAGADQTRVMVIEAVKRDGRGKRGFDLQVDLDLLDVMSGNMGDVRLLVIDPISEYLGRVDSHRTTDVRFVLAPISELAGRHRTAVVSITHFNKVGGATANSRFTGSTAFVTTPRSAYVVVMDLQDPEPDEDRRRRLFLPSKNNLAPLGRGFGFHTVGVDLPGSIGATRIEWDEGPVTLTALPQAEAKNSAADFLRAVLRDGPKAARDIQAEAEAAGFAGRPSGVPRPTSASMWRRSDSTASGSGRWCRMGRSGRWSEAGGIPLMGGVWESHCAKVRRDHDILPLNYFSELVRCPRMCRLESLNADWRVSTWRQR
jgi:hypothetical protein